MFPEEPLRFDGQKRLQTVNGLPSKLIRKFIIVENRDSRGRVAFHIAFKKSKHSRPDRSPIPKKYRTFYSLIEAELAIFEMVQLYLDSDKEFDLSFIEEKTFFKKIIIFIKTVTGIILNK